jgi:hypothetical protein
VIESITALSSTERLAEADAFRREFADGEILIVVTENRIVLTIVGLIDLGLVASFDHVQPYILRNCLFGGGLAAFLS